MRSVWIYGSRGLVDISINRHNLYNSLITSFNSKCSISREKDAEPSSRIPDSAVFRPK